MFVDKQRSPECWQLTPVTHTAFDYAARMAVNENRAERATIAHFTRVHLKILLASISVLGINRLLVDAAVAK